MDEEESLQNKIDQILPPQKPLDTRNFFQRNKTLLIIIFVVLLFLYITVNIYIKNSLKNLNLTSGIQLSPTIIINSSPTPQNMLNNVGENNTQGWQKGIYTPYPIEKNSVSFTYFYPSSFINKPGSQSLHIDKITQQNSSQPGGEGLDISLSASSNISFDDMKTMDLQALDGQLTNPSKSTTEFTTTSRLNGQEIIVKGSLSDHTQIKAVYLLIHTGKRGDNGQEVYIIVDGIYRYDEKGLYLNSGKDDIIENITKTISL